MLLRFHSPLGEKRHRRTVRSRCGGIFRLLSEDEQVHIQYSENSKEKIKQIAIQRTIHQGYETPVFSQINNTIRLCLQQLQKDGIFSFSSIFWITFKVNTPSGCSTISDMSNTSRYL